MIELQQLKGLGPKSQAMLAQVGIVRVEQLMAADPFMIYTTARHNPEFIAQYAVCDDRCARKHSLASHPV